ncbi:2Fe-2S iron-sulfur cluster-binding protein [Streptomyces sp.]|uniref:2Fe-2S iron-sulfur cluster-binding protein n=1 Tax=Streptomyces sp. TaxID=1931 RepID=UPI002811CCC7|nr:2Fe-2S iron-sulfur cluster-binding protein [Streptomyces sp.]
MTDDQHEEGTPRGGGRWDPLPQGDYDDGATAFVKLPEGGVDALLDSMESPLAAPGHGYVPPQITVTPATTAGTDPAVTGAWPAPGAPVDGAHWHDPQAAQAQAGHPQQEPGADAAAPPSAGQDRFTYPPGATGQWGYEEAPAEQSPAPGHDVTGQWSIPVADGDLPDESGEFTTSALVEQWGGTPPATLPGGAPAPWATQAIGQPWGPGVPGVPQERQDGGPGPAQQRTAGQADADPGAEGRGDGPAQHRAGVSGPSREQQDGGPRSHDEPGRADDPAPRQPAGPDGYGGQPAQDAWPAPDTRPDAQPARGASASEQPLGERAPGRPGAGSAPEPSGLPGHAPGQPEQPAHAGPRPSGVPQPFATEEHAGPAAEPPWRSDADAAYPAGAGAEDADGAPAGLREHPHPGSQDASRPASGTGAASGASGTSEEAHEAPEGAPGVSEAAHGQAEPSADATRPGPQEGAGPEPAADGGAPAAGSASPDTATAQDTPDPAGSPDAVDASAAPAGSSPSAAPAPDGSAPPHDPPPGTPFDDHPLASYVLRVNGSDRPVTDAWIGESLLYVLRERLGLAGAKDGCSQGECGACNVQVDGRLVASCLVPAVTAAGSEVRTVEGLAQGGRPSDVQRALARCGAVQCGFCVPGMAMTVHDLLEGNPAPTELETRQALCGNLCRCSGYRGVVEAVKEVVAEREAHAAAPEPDPDADTDADAPRIPHQAGPGAGGVNPSAFGPTGPHDQPYGQDGGQA